MIGDSVSDRLKEMADNGDEIAIQKLSSCPKCSVQYADRKDKITLCSMCEKQEAEDEMPEYQPVDLTKYVVTPESEVICIVCRQASYDRSGVCGVPGCVNTSAKKRIDELNDQIRDYFFKPAVKHDGDKNFGYSLLPWEAVDELAKLYAFGANKYTANNWRNGSGLGYLRCFNAMFRHLVAWIGGSDMDSETGLHPLASVAFYCFAVIYYEKTGRKIDDRYKPDLR